ncbi:MAG: PAS domain-containing sensor histidine kinase, partial [Flavobacterium sp.]|nr:PAS domain-containing sensor histidine kinase [Flavobacterium sp.]
MKNRTNQITIVYILISILLAIVSHKVIIKYISPESLPLINFIKDILFILGSGIILKYLLYKNDIQNSDVVEKLKKTNDEIKESNERYDIVSKATSDTIWDWKIQED